MKAWELLSSRHRWTKRAFARLENGDETESTDPDAVCWCVGGAIERIYPDVCEIRVKIYIKLNQYLRKEFKYDGGPINWNDIPTTTHEEVVRVLKELDI
jgi:hypothetical protein